MRMRRRSVRGLQRQKAGLGERKSDELEQIPVIVGNQDLHSAGTVGSTTLKRVRPSVVRPALTSPSVPVDDGLDDPQAEPEAGGFGLLVACRGRSARRSRRQPVAARPVPSSSTHASTWSPCWRAPTRMLEPSGANLLALASRFTNTWVRRGLSPSTGAGRHGGRAGVSDGAGSAGPRSAPRACSTTSLRSTDLVAEGKLAGLDADALQKIIDEPRQPHRAPLERQYEIPAGLRVQRCPGPRASSSIEASCAASGVRNSCEMFARMESRARRTALELGLVADHLHLQVVRRARTRDDGRAGRHRDSEIAAPCTAHCRRRRACRIGQSRSQGRIPPFPRGFSTSPQNCPTASAADTPSSSAALRVQVADRAIPVHGVHALDDAVEHRLRFGLAAVAARRSGRRGCGACLPSCGREFRPPRAAARDGRGEVTLARGAWRPSVSCAARARNPSVRGTIPASTARIPRGSAIERQAAGSARRLTAPDAATGSRVSMRPIASPGRGEHRIARRVHAPGSSQPVGGEAPVAEGAPVERE